MHSDFELNPGNKKLLAKANVTNALVKAIEAIHEFGITYDSQMRPFDKRVLNDQKGKLEKLKSGIRG